MEVRQECVGYLEVEAWADEKAGFAEPAFGRKS
jgi:hypothetical protein